MYAQQWPAVTPSAQPQWCAFFLPLPALQAQREQGERGSISRATAEAMAAEATAAVAARVAAGGSSSGLSWRRGGSMDYGGCAIDWEAEEVGNGTRPNFTAATGSIDIAAEGRGPASPLPLAGHFIVCGAEVRVGSWGLWVEPQGQAARGGMREERLIGCVWLGQACPAAHQFACILLPWPVRGVPPTCLALAHPCSAGVVCAVCGAAAQVWAAGDAHRHPAPHPARGELA